MRSKPIFCSKIASQKDKKMLNVGRSAKSCSKVSSRAQSGQACVGLVCGAVNGPLGHENKGNVKEMAYKNIEKCIFLAGAL